MVDLERLKKAIHRKGLSYSEIAKALEITRSCMSKKMSGVIDFKVSQVYLLAELLKLSEQERDEIFYKNEVTDNEINVNVNLSNLDEYTKKISDFTQAIEKANSVLKELTNSDCKIILEIKN